jgi:hypothetical protein
MRSTFRALILFSGLALLAASASAVAQRGRPYRPPPIRLPPPRIEMPRWEPPRTTFPWEKPATPRLPWETPATPRYPWEKPTPRFPWQQEPPRLSEAELRQRALENHRSSVTAKVSSDPAGALADLSGTVLTLESMKRLGYRPTVSDLLGLKTIQLPNHERASLARLAAQNLARSASEQLIRPERNDRWSRLPPEKSLAQTRQLRKMLENARLDASKHDSTAAATLQGPLDAALKREQSLARACLATELARAVRLAEAGDLSSAALVANTRSADLAASGIDTSRLREFSELESERIDLDRAGAVVKKSGKDLHWALEDLLVVRAVSPRWSHRGTLATSRRRVGSAGLSNPLWALHDLTVLEQAARTPLTAAQASALRDTAASLRNRSETPALGRRAQRELAVKAFLDGCPDMATELLEAGDLKGKSPPPEDQAACAALLRDVKVMVAGEGEVTTWPAGAAVAPQGGGGPRAPPPGVALLLPEAEARGWRLPVREKASADLPPLPEALAEQVEAGRQRLQATLKSQRRAWEGRRTQAIRLAGGQPVKPAPSAGSSSASPDDEDEKLFRKLENLLGRKLTAAEKKKTREGRARGLSAEQIRPLLGGIIEMEK